MFRYILGLLPLFRLDSSRVVRNEWGKKRLGCIWKAPGSDSALCYGALSPLSHGAPI